MPRTILSALIAAVVLIGISGCANHVPKYDYTAFRMASPKSILILPPTNQSPDIRASGSVLATATYPVAEDGYYVFPVALVAQTFKDNGVTNPGEIAQLPISRLRKVFGADAALYINIKQYGAVYMIVVSDVRVTLEAKLIDLRTGDLLWSGNVTADNQGGNSSQSGLVGMLIQAIVEQIANSLTDSSYRVGAIANMRLLTANGTNGLLYGPRSPMYEKQ